MTLRQAARAVVWFKERMKLQDWTVTVFVCDEPPQQFIVESIFVLGSCIAHATYKEADIWVSPKRNKDMKMDAYSTLFHEMFHIVASDVGIKKDSRNDREAVWNVLGDCFAELYRKRNRKG